MIGQLERDHMYMQYSIRELLTILLENSDKLDGLLSKSKNIKKSTYMFRNSSIENETFECPPCPDDTNPELWEDAFLSLAIARKKSAREGAERNGRIADTSIRKEEPPMPKQIEGSKPYQRKDGRWQSIFYEDRTPKTVYARTKLDCINKVNEAVRNRDKNANDTVVSKRVVLATWIPQWLEIYKKGKLKESSYATLKYVMKTIEKASIAKKEIVKLTAIDIEKFLNGIQASVTRQRVFVYLNECIDALVKNRTIRENVCTLVSKPSKPISKEKYVPELNEMQEFLDRLKIESPTYFLFTKFLAATGLRVGEALALKWSDVDFENKTLSVSKAYDRVTKTVTSPKTKKSVRTIPLFYDAAEVLKKIKHTSEPIFSFIGRTSNVHNFSAAAKRCGMNKLTLHSLRHVFATRCLESGVDPKVIQKWLGHTKIDLSMNLYAHANGNFEQEQIVKMAKHSH